MNTLAAMIDIPLPEKEDEFAARTACHRGRKGVLKMEKDKAIRVLIVDDEERFRSTTAATLENRNFCVTAVSDGFQAIEQVRHNEIDVIVLDVKMPGMDGNEALLKIKALRPELPVVMLTGYGFPVCESKTYLGRIYYLNKPCDIDTLAAMIEQAHRMKKDSRKIELSSSESSSGSVL